jgi:hypothetical protein
MVPRTRLSQGGQSRWRVAYCLRTGPGLPGEDFALVRQLLQSLLVVKTYRSGDAERTSDEPPIAAELVQSRERGMCAKSRHSASPQSAPPLHSRFDLAGRDEEPDRYAHKKQGKRPAHDRAAALVLKPRPRGISKEHDS